MIKGFVLALQFLTRIPININIDFNDKNIRNSLVFYPYVGALIGLLTWLIYSLFKPFGIEVQSLFALLSITFISGGLHLDGLSDTLDGFMSGRDREKTMDIMRDSRVGAFGVIGIVFILLFKYILIKSFSDVFYPLILSLGNARLISIYLIASKKTARPDGLGNIMQRSSNRVYIFISSVVYLIAILLIKPIFILPLALSFIFAEILAYISNKKIGGLTGDVYGAAIEITECLSLLTFLGVYLWK